VSAAPPSPPRPHEGIGATRVRARWPRGALVALLLLAGPPAEAAGDYALDDRVWNGVGYLLETAREARVEVIPVDVLELESLEARDVLLWLYPRREPPTESLLAFVGDGGHVVLADDHGASRALLDALGIERREQGPSGHRRWYEGDRGLPVLRRSGDHFLFFNVDEIVANHPAALVGEGIPRVSFDDGTEHLIIERRYGAGAFLIIADPSIFLNQMLRRFYGNKQLAANVLRVFCVQEPCRVRLLLPDSRVVGDYRGGPQRGPLPRMLELAAEQLNDALSGISEGLSRPPWSIVLALLTALAIALAVALALATWRRPARAPVLPAARLGAISPLLSEAAGLAAVRAEADFHGLAITLTEHAEHLARARGIDAAVEGSGPLPRGETMSTLEPVRHALLRVRREVASLRSAQPPVVSSDRFVRLYDDVRILARFGSRSR